MRSRIKSAMRQGVRVLSHSIKVWIASFLAMTCRARLYNAGTPTSDRDGRAGYGRHGGDGSTGSLTAPALCVGTNDVGLELLVLLTSSNLRFLSREKDMKSAAIDARNRTRPRWHDMAAG